MSTLIDSDALVWLTRGHIGIGAAQRLQATKTVPNTPAVSEHAPDLIVTLALSDGMRLADALIGGDAVEHGATLVTANVKHFGAVNALNVEAFSP